MQWLMTRFMALGVALVVTVALIFGADLASKYVGKRTHPPRPPQEYTINLGPAPPTHP